MERSDRHNAGESSTVGYQHEAGSPFTVNRSPKKMSDNG
jgi:hypothetical protein